MMIELYKQNIIEHNLLLHPIYFQQIIYYHMLIHIFHNRNRINNLLQHQRHNNFLYFF